MRFNEITKVHYLNEQDDMSREQIKEIIERDCAPYLEQIGDKPLLRGMPIDQQFLKKRTRLADRIPKDSPPELHKMINKYFVKAFKRPFRNAMFCTGVLADAKTYGTAYAVYPIGKFQYLWSPSVTDLWTTYEDNLYDMTEQIIDNGFPREDAENMTPEFLNKTYKLFLKEFVVGEFIHNKGLQKAIQSGKEVMVWCEEYYAVKYE